MTQLKATQSELRWRKFAQEYTSNGFLANAAARAAGYPEDDVKAGVAQTLLRRPEVLRYIRTLGERVASKYAITRDFIYEGLEDAFLKAQEQDNPAAMVKAIMGMAQIAGLVTEKHEHKVTDLSKILDDDLQMKKVLE